MQPKHNAFRVFAKKNSCGVKQLIQILSRIPIQNMYISNKNSSNEISDSFHKTIEYNLFLYINKKYFKELSRFFCETV